MTSPPPEGPTFSQTFAAALSTRRVNVGTASPARGRRAARFAANTHPSSASSSPSSHLVALPTPAEPPLAGTRLYVRRADSLVRARVGTRQRAPCPTLFCTPDGTRHLLTPARLIVSWKSNASEHRDVGGGLGGG